MFANVMAHTRKPLSVVMALLLAALLVPVVPGTTPRALAAGGATYNDFTPTETSDIGLVTKGVRNNHTSADAVTFDQAFDSNAVLGKIGEGTLTKPAVDAADTTLIAAAKTAASAAVADSAAGSKDTDAAEDATSKNTELTSAAEVARDAQVQVLFGKTANQEAAIAAATEKAKAAHPDADIKDVKLSTNADGSHNVTTTWGTLGIATKAAAVTSPSATEGGVAFTLGDDNWAVDSFALDVSGVTSSNTGAVSVGLTSGSTLGLTAVDAGTATMTVPYTYAMNITGGQSTFGYTYNLEYTPTYEYTDCTYTCDFTYTYGDGDTEASDTTDAFSLSEAPAGDLSNQTATITKTDGSTTFSLDAPYTPKDTGFAGAGNYTYDLTIENLFTDTFAEDGALTGIGPFTYNDAAQEGVAVFTDTDFAKADAALSFLGEPTVTVADSEDTTPGFEVSYDQAAGTVDVTPLNATAPEGETVTLTWTLPDGTSITRTITAVVNPLEITYTAEAQPFRLQSVQQERVLADANQKVIGAIKTATGDTVTDNYYRSVTFESYDGQGVAQEPNVTFVTESSVADTFTNYKVVDTETVVVNAMQNASWDTTALALAAKNGTQDVSLNSGNATTQWIDTKPTASWASYRLAYATKGVPEGDQADAAFASSVELSGGDGTHSVEMYAMNSDGVISQVTGISYMLDTQAPVLASAEASAPQKAEVFGGILFGDSVINVEFALVDEVKNDQADSADTIDKVASSGVNSAETSASYTDTENGQADIPADLSGDAPFYSFSIKGDKDVPTNSIKVHAADNAGNVLDTTADQARDIPMEYLRLVSDASAPQIAINWDTFDARNGHYYQTNRTMTITINEEFFNYVVDYGNSQVVTTVYQNGQAVIEVHPSDFTEVEKNVWSYTLSFTADADWDVRAPVITDIIGRSASVAGDTFTIDKTNPTMDVSFDNNAASNGNYYNAARTATIVVTEHNFSGDSVNITPTANAGNGDTVGQPAIGGWSSSGDVHTATVTFPGEGVYAMTIDGMDLAQNALASYSVEEFIVDTVMPEISITMNGSEAAGGDIVPYASEALVAVAVHDTNVDTASEISVASGELNKSNPYEAAKARSETATDITVDFGNPESVSENDGVYTLSVTSTDKAGNSETKDMAWSVNRFGSTYLLMGDTSAMLGKYLTKGSLTDVRVREINPSGLADYDVELSKGTSVSTLKEDTDYKVANEEKGGWHQYDYTVSKGGFESDGLYHVLFHSTDKANKTSDNSSSNASQDRTSPVEVSFAVDETPPTCDFLNLDDAVYNEAGHKAQVSFKDNLLLQGASVKVTDLNDDTVLYEKTLSDKGEGFSAEGTTVEEIDLADRANGQKIVVSAKDAAGNTNTSERSVLVTTDVVALVMSNTPLLVGSVVGGVAVLALGGVGVGALVKRRKAGTGKAA